MAEQVQFINVNTTGKRPLGKPRHKCEDNIRMDLKEIYINMSNWVDSAQDRDYWRVLVNAALGPQSRSDREKEGNKERTGSRTIERERKKEQLLNEKAAFHQRKKSTT